MCQRTIQDRETGRTIMFVGDAFVRALVEEPWSHRLHSNLLHWYVNQPYTGSVDYEWARERWGSPQPLRRLNPSTREKLRKLIDIGVANLRRWVALDREESGFPKLRGDRSRWGAEIHISAKETWELFALRCACGRWTLGCEKHWVCGVCERCRQRWESGRPAGFYHDSPVFQRFRIKLQRAVEESAWPDGPQPAGESSRGDVGRALK